MNRRRSPSPASVILSFLFTCFLVFSILLPSSTDATSLPSSTPQTLTAEKRLSSRIVTTKYGSLRGYVVTLPNRSLQPVEVFMGIPYASPPVGKLRFMPPVTPAHWTGIRPAHSPGPVCPQRLPNISNQTQALQSMTPGRVSILTRLLPSLQNQSEDCLYLNIYTPASVGKESIRLPVLMFIHGESFEWNSGSTYDGSVLSSFTNVLVVTINFRLGILGFFPALEGNSRGNFGLMDQVAALHWIQENIHEFGGDPTNVSIMGHGHGAALANLLMLSPMARGLFHRTILMTGSALSPWGMTTDAIIHSRKLAGKLACPSVDEPEKSSLIVDCLRTKSVAELTSIDIPSPKFLTNLGPTVDGIVIPNDPQVMMESSYSSNFGSYDLLFGVPKVAYYDFSMGDERHGIDVTRRERILRTLVRNLYTFHQQEILLAISNEYQEWGKNPSAIHSTDVFESVVDLLSDATVNGPLTKVALMHSKQTRRNSFSYEFIHGTERGDYPSHLGCINGDDLAYFFGAPIVSGMQLGYFSSTFNKAEAALSEMVLTFFGNFIRSGNPNVDGNHPLPATTTKNEANNIRPTSSHSSSSSSSSSSMKMTIPHSESSNSYKIDKIPWPHFDDKQQQFMSISLKPKLKDHFHSHRLSYWNSLIPKLHVPSGSSNPAGHFLSNHDDLTSYEGVIREETVVSRLSLTNITISLGTGNTSSTGTSSSKVTNVKGSHPQSIAISDQESKSQEKGKTTTVKPVDSTKTLNPGGGSVSAMFQEGTYSTALSVVIGVGLSLIVLNLLVFAGMFYHKDRVLNGSSNIVHSVSSTNNDRHRSLRKDKTIRHDCSSDTHKTMDSLMMSPFDEESTTKNVVVGTGSGYKVMSTPNRRISTHAYPGDPSLSIPDHRMSPTPSASSQTNLDHVTCPTSSHVSMINGSNTSFSSSSSTLRNPSSKGSSSDGHHPHPIHHHLQTQYHPVSHHHTLPHHHPHHHQVHHQIHHQVHFNPSSQHVHYATLASDLNGGGGALIDGKLINSTSHVSFNFPDEEQQQQQSDHHQHHHLHHDEHNHLLEEEERETQEQDLNI